jgi:SAM-dependent methyltransferase
MHPSAMMNCKLFFDRYGGHFPPGTPARLIEIGSQDVNGSLRDLAPKHIEYIGVDFASGKGVDVILDDPYKLPFGDASADLILSSSCFEHSEMFWLVFLEIMRVLKPHGLFYLNVPSNGAFHRHPVDCWRFYPDSGNALVSWGRRNGLNPLVLESYTSRQLPDDTWNDFVGVFLKDASHASRYPARIVDTFRDFSNGLKDGQPEVFNYTQLVEEQLKLAMISQVSRNQIRVTPPQGGQP